MGSTINNYHLGYVIKTFISQDIFDLYSTTTSRMVGGFTLRKSFTEKELYKNVGFGFHLFMPAPASGGVRGIKCAEQETFTDDQ